MDTATEYPSRVRNSADFKQLVVQFNQRRQAQGQDPIQVALPDFATGNFDDDLQQLEMDAIRGYNGWNGSDRFGFELHEFRVAVSPTDGDDVLVVANTNEQTLTGEAVWERVPVADRPTDRGSPNYVEEVLAFNLDCSPHTVPLVVDIKAEDGTTAPCRILAPGKSRKYRAVVAPPGGTFKWTCTGGASIVGSASAAQVTVKGHVVSATVDDVALTLRYAALGKSQSGEVKLTVADVTKIAVRVKASAPLTPGRGSPLKDHQFDCTESVEDFPPDKSLLLLRGDFEDVELQATVNPTGTPLAWDVKRASDDDAALGAGIPTVTPDSRNVMKAKLKTNETGSFFVRVFADCGNKKFDANGPFKLVPTVLVRATLNVDASERHRLTARAKVVNDTFSVTTGNFDLNDPQTALIHMKALVDIVSGGESGLRLIDQVFAGWVNNIRSTKTFGKYASAHALFVVFAENRGTGPVGIFIPGDVPNFVQPPVQDPSPILDTVRLSAGTGGDTVILGHSRLKRNARASLGKQLQVDSVDSPFERNVPLFHPAFSTPADPVRLESFHFEDHFTAHLCLWTNRSGTSDDVAERSYGVLRSFRWQLVGEWEIDDKNNPTATKALSADISGGVTRDPLATPNAARCEVCPPSAADVGRFDARS